MQESIQTINSEDIKAFHQKYYRPENCTLVITGAFKHKDVISIAKQYQGAKTANSDPVIPPTGGRVNDLVLDDYLTGERYVLYYTYKIQNPSAKETVIAKVLPYLMQFGTRNYDHLSNKPLDYDILLNYQPGYFTLSFIYQDYQDEFNSELSNWHRKNLTRYFNRLKFVRYDALLKYYAKYLDATYKSYMLEPANLNAFYSSLTFDPATITSKEFRTLSSIKQEEFISFVERYLDKGSCQQFIVNLRCNS